jgi:hypothetical protein
MISVDTILNFAWAGTCAGALGYFWPERKAGARRRVVFSRQTLSVILAAVTLFPCISATDDRARLADLAGSSPRHVAFESGALHGVLLSLQLEDPAHGQTAEPFLLVFTASSPLIRIAETPKVARLFSYSSLGRAPPPRSAP